MRLPWTKELPIQEDLEPEDVLHRLGRRRQRVWDHGGCHRGREKGTKGEESWIHGGKAFTWKAGALSGATVNGGDGKFTGLLFP